MLTLAMREAMASSVADDDDDDDDLVCTIDDGDEDGSNLSNTRPPLPPLPLLVLPPEAISAPLPPTMGGLDDMIEMRELGAGLAGPHTGSKGNFFRESLKAERNLSAAEDDGPPPPPAELLPLPLMVAEK